MAIFGDFLCGKHLFDTYLGGRFCHYHGGFYHAYHHARNQPPPLQQNHPKRAKFLASHQKNAQRNRRIFADFFGSFATVFLAFVKFDRDKYSAFLYLLQIYANRCGEQYPG